MALAFSLFGNLGLKTDQFEAGTARAKQELTELQKFAAASTRGITSLGTSLGGLAAGALSLVAVKSALTDIVRVGIDVSRLQASFAAVAGSADLGRQQFAFVAQTANRLGLEVQGLAEQYRSLLAATRGTALTGQDIQSLFTGITRTGQAFGLSSEQIGRALLALQQIVSKGKVSQEELRQQLGEALPGASQIATRAYGVTTQALDKMVEHGLDATDFFRRFSAQLEKEAPAAVEQAGAGFARLGNELLMLKTRLAQGGLLQFFENIAAVGAQILATSRVAGEEQESAIRRSAQQALGGTITLKNLSPTEVQRLSDITAVLTEAEARAQNERLTPMVRERARAEAVALRTLQQEIVDELKRGRAMMDLFTEMEPQLSPQQRQLLREQAQQRLSDMAEIGKEQNAQGEEIFKDLFGLDLPQETEKALADMATDNQKRRAEHFQDIFGLTLSPEQEQDLETMAQQQHDRLQEFARELDILGLARPPEEERQLRRQTEETQRLLERAAESREHGIERVLEGLSAERNALLLTRQETVQLTLAQLGAGEGAQRMAEGLLETAKMAHLARNAAELVTSALVDMATAGEMNLRQLQQTLTRFALQTLQDAIGLREALTTLFRNLLGTSRSETGLVGLVGKLFSGADTTTSGGAGAAADLAAGAQLAEIGMLQHGGWTLPGQAYLVGERGPEVFRPAERGYVYPHGTGPLSPVVNIYITTPDVGSFRATERQIGRRAGAALLQSLRG